jgi:phage tail protein X
MAIQPETVTVGAEGLTLSLIVWRRFYRPKPGLIERVYALNPGLAELGIILPVGTVFLLPVDPEENRTQRQDVISLWD